MKKLTSILSLVTIILFSSCSNEISQTKIIKENELKFMHGEKSNTKAHSYIINAIIHHPFLFRDQLDVVKDKSVAIDAKSKLVYQTIKNHIETNGKSENNQYDVQRLIFYLYGDYRKIDRSLIGIQNEHHEYFLNALIDFKAIDFKYLARISKYIDSDDSYVLPKSKEYLDKYENIILEQGLENDPGYGRHCLNIIESCNKAIEMLQNS
jgi:hypothetical protein